MEKNWPVTSHACRPDESAMPQKGEREGSKSADRTHHEDSDRRFHVANRGVLDEVGVRMRDLGEDDEGCVSE